MWLLLSLLFYSVAGSQEWTAESYPNPRKGGYKQCNMRSSSNICDPDEVLTESERYRLNSELQRLSSRTEEAGTTFCARKGVDSVLAITADGTQKLASDLNSKWNLDGQCEKSVVFVLAVDDRKLYYAGERNTGIDPAEFLAIVSAGEVQLKTGQYTMAIVNVLKELGKKSNPVAIDATTAPPTRAAATSLLLSLPITALALLL